MIQRTIDAACHGRYLVEARQTGLPLLVGFHGYAESAETELTRLRTMEESSRWIVLSIQGLHRFYRGRSNDIVASWMTSQDRELAIADNNLYTTKVIASVSHEWSTDGPIVLTGFSQGVAMAFRCASSLERTVSSVIALGGDVPPELDATALRKIPAVLLGRGTQDEWYTEQKLAADEQRLRSAGVDVQIATFQGGHEWTPEFGQAAARFLESRR